MSASSTHRATVCTLVDCAGVGDVSGARQTNVGPLKANIASLRSTAVALLAVLAILTAAPRALADEAVVTTAANFEDTWVLPSIGETVNVTAADCEARYEGLPARGQSSLAIEIGATGAGAGVVCNLRFRHALFFKQADRISAVTWLKDGEVDVAFRIRDAEGRVFESKAQPVRYHDRWFKIESSLGDADLTRVSSAGATASGPGKVVWPIEVAGLRITNARSGRQIAWIDDIQVEHRVPIEGQVRGVIHLNEATHLYQPGATATATVTLENLSRKSSQNLTVELLCTRGNGALVQRSTQTITMPAARAESPAKQGLPFTQPLVEPGLYRLVARVTGQGWPRPAEFETTVAAFPSNRAIPRGRETFFGVRSNLLREPPDDQALEIEVAQQIGVQLLALDVPWSVIEPRPGDYRWKSFDAAIDAIDRHSLACTLTITDPPAFLTDDSKLATAQAGLIAQLVKRCGSRIRGIQPVADSRGDAERSALATAAGDVPLLAFPVDVSKVTGYAPRQIATGTFIEAAATLEKSVGGKCKPTDWWLHAGIPSGGAGTPQDAIEYLQFALVAARCGAGQLLLADLRDDTDDARDAEHMRGLVRRDFSPKAALLGFASTVGMLSGLHFANTPADLPLGMSGALFMGGERQVLVLTPQAHRELPGLVNLKIGAAGDLQAYDFSRKPATVLNVAGQTFARPEERPLFVQLTCKQTQNDPQIQVKPSWLRLPRFVRVGRESTTRVELDVLPELKARFMQFSLPGDAPYVAKGDAVDLQSQTGKTATFDLALSQKPEPPRVVAGTLRIATQAQPIDVPIEIVPTRVASRVASIADALGTTPSFELFTRGANSTPGTGVPTYVAWDDRSLHILVELNRMPMNAAVLVELAADGAERTSAIIVRRSSDKLSIVGEAFGASVDKLDNKVSGRATCHIALPAAWLGKATFVAGTRAHLRLQLRNDNVRSADLAALTPADCDTGVNDGFIWIELLDTK